MHTLYRLLGSKLRCIFQKGAWLWVKFLIVKIKLLTDKDMSRPNFGESCRPLEQREVLEVLWTTYPPAATQLNVRSSRWLRPRSKGTEAWSLLGTLWLPPYCFISSVSLQSRFSIISNINALLNHKYAWCKTRYEIQYYYKNITKSLY